MRARSLRLTAALTTAAMGASLATPALEGAVATSGNPQLPDLSGLPISNVQTVISELQSLQAVAPGGSLPSGSLSGLEGSVNSLLGNTLGPVFAVLNTLLGANPASAAYITQLLTDVQQHAGSASDPAALDELEAALTTAGLGQLLSAAPGLGSQASQIQSALAALASLQSLPVGSDAPSGSLAPVASLLSTLAGQSGVPANVATTLNSVAGHLNGGVSPSQLETAIGQLESAASALPAGQASLTTALDALAAQLADGSSIFGGLGSVGNAPSAASVLAALQALGNFGGLPSGSTVPGGSLAPLAAILTQVAGEPGVAGTPAGTTLTNVATVLSDPADSLAPSQLITLLALLQGAADQLPAPLGGDGGVVTGLVQALSAVGPLSGSTSSTTTTSQTTTSQTTTPSQTTTATSTTHSQTTSAGSGGSTGSSGSSSSSGSKGSSGSHPVTALHGGTVKVLSYKRSGQSVRFSLTCTASKGRNCTANVGVNESNYVSQTKKVTVGGGAKKSMTVTLHLKRGHRASRRRQKIRAVVHSGSYRFSKLV